MDTLQQLVERRNLVQAELDAANQSIREALDREQAALDSLRATLVTVAPRKAKRHLTLSPEERQRRSDTMRDTMRKRANATVHA